MSGEYYHTSASEFKTGQRVEVHPASDAWMRGDRFGTVERIGKSTIVFVRMDKSNRVRWFHAESLAIIEDVPTRKVEPIADDLYMCVDCLVSHANGEDTGDDKRDREISDGMNALGGHIALDYDSNTEDGMKTFSWSPCDCCKSPLGGARYRFVVFAK